MIRHQAIRDDLDRMACDGFAQEAQVLVAIGVLEEHVATMIAALGDVVRDAGEHEARLSWHLPKVFDRP